MRRVWRWRAEDGLAALEDRLRREAGVAYHREFVRWGLARQYEQTPSPPPELPDILLR